jgi:Flagellar biosynthesis protein, FliO
MGTAVLAWKQNALRWKRWMSTPIASFIGSRRLSRDENRLRVEQTAAIGNKGTLAMVSVEGQRVLVGVTQGSVQFYGVTPATALRFRLEGKVR